MVGGGNIQVFVTLVLLRLSCFRVNLWQCLKNKNSLAEPSKINVLVKLFITGRNTFISKNFNVLQVFLLLIARASIILHLSMAL